MERKQDFSVREEVRVLIEETLEKGESLTIDEIMDKVVNDELMIEAISYCIYAAAEEVLAEKNKQSDEIEFGKAQRAEELVRLMMNMGLI